MQQAIAAFWRRVGTPEFSYVTSPGVRSEDTYNGSRDAQAVGQRVDADEMETTRGCSIDVVCIQTEQDTLSTKQNYIDKHIPVILRGTIDGTYRDLHCIPRSLTTCW